MQRITIIGLGPVGASIGMSLKNSGLKNIEITGTSADRDVLSKASKLGVVDNVVDNLRSAVEAADIVILDVPLVETKELMEAIAPILKSGSVVTDTGAAKNLVMEWFEEYLPAGINFVSGHPILKKRPSSLAEANPNLFEDRPYCLIPSKSASRDSVRTIVDVIEMMGAKPLFLDINEHDSYAAAMTYLPIVLSAAYVSTTTRSNSWRDMIHLAGSEFADLSMLVSNDPQESEMGCLSNPDTLVHWLDKMITELYSYRNHIKERSDQLLDNFIRGWEAQARWEVGASTNDDEEKPKLPSAGEYMASTMVGGRLFDRYKQMMDKDKKKETWKYDGKK